jgi:hypothetical protein
MLTPEILKSYLLEMPEGHIFDMPYALFADVFPPGAADKGAWRRLRALAAECGFEVRAFPAEERIELIKT